jgi:hypothetical protein
MIVIRRVHHTGLQGGLLLCLPVRTDCDEAMSSGGVADASRRRRSSSSGNSCSAAASSQQ